MSAAATDGRRRRGQQRKTLILDAALEVIARDGASALTHRSIAEQAGIPLASVSYHFDGIDAVLINALERATDDLAAELRASPPGSTPAELADLLARELRAQRSLWIAGYELYLLAARRPGFAATALAWIDVVADHFAPSLDGDDRRAFQALVEGVCLHALLDRDRLDGERIRGVISAGWPQPARR